MGFHLLPGGLSRMKCLLGEHNGAEVSNHFATGPLLASTPRSERRECHILSVPITRYIMITIVQWLCGMSSAPMMDWGGCDARQDATQRAPEVAGLRSDRQWHSRERARQWTLMTSAGRLQQIGKVVCEGDPACIYIYIPPLPTAWGLPHLAGHGYDRADSWGWWGCRDLVKRARTPACCHGNWRQHGDLPALSVAISWSLTTLPQLLSQVPIPLNNKKNTKWIHKRNQLC